MEPTGAPAPLERQKVRAVTLAAMAATGAPRAAAALNRRAPSRWMGRRAAAAQAATASMYARDRHAPPHLLWLDSRHSTAVTAACCPGGPAMDCVREE